MFNSIFYLMFFIVFSVVGIIGNEIEEDKTIKVCFNLIKFEAYIGITLSLINIYITGC